MNTIPSKTGKMKKYHKILTKFKRILLKIMKITSGTKVPKIVKFCQKWDFFALFYTPNITLSHLYFIFSRFAQLTAFNTISDSANYIGLIPSRSVGRDIRPYVKLYRFLPHIARGTPPRDTRTFKIYIISGFNLKEY